MVPESIPKITDYHGEGPVTKVNVGRLTNSIFAFTLLYLFKNINIPTIFETDTPGYLTSYIKQVIPELGNFMNAFILIAIIWILTFHIMHRMKKVNHTYLYIHFCMLMTLVFIPVSSMLADNYPQEPLFSMILHLNVLCIGILLIGEWKYINDHGTLLHYTQSKREDQDSLNRLIILILATCVGIYLAISDYEGTRFVYLPILFLLLTYSIMRGLRKGKISGDQNEAIPPHAHTNQVQVREEIRQESSFKAARDFAPVEIGMLEILINGVFGFTMTLIVKNIPLPKVTDAENIELMFTFFIRIATDTIEFVLIFVVLAMIWVLVFQLLRWMKHVDLFIVYLMFAELLVIVFIPITSSLFTFFHDQPHISTIYALNILLCGLILLIQWYHLSSNPDLLQEEARTELCSHQKRRWIEELTTVITDIGRRESFFEIRNRLYILPIATAIWITMNLGGIPFSVLPVLIGIGYLLFRSRDLNNSLDNI